MTTTSINVSRELASQILSDIQQLDAAVLSGLRGASKTQDVSDTERVVGWRSVRRAAGVVHLLLQQASKSSTSSASSAVADFVVAVSGRTRHHQRYAWLRCTRVRVVVQTP